MQFEVFFCNPKVLWWCFQHNYQLHLLRSLSSVCDLSLRQKLFAWPLFFFILQSSVNERLNLEQEKRQCCDETQLTAADERNQRRWQWRRSFVLAPLSTSFKEMRMRHWNSFTWGRTADETRSKRRNHLLFFVLIFSLLGLTSTHLFLLLETPKLFE